MTDNWAGNESTPGHPMQIVRPVHNHPTRDIKPQGQCPGCDAYHNSQRPRVGIVKRSELGDDWTAEAHLVQDDGVSEGSNNDS